MFVAGWRHALRSEWPFIIILIISIKVAGVGAGLEVFLCVWHGAKSAEFWFQVFPFLTCLGPRLCVCMPIIGRWQLSLLIHWHTKCQHFIFGRLLVVFLVVFELCVLVVNWRHALLSRGAGCVGSIDSWR